MAGCSCVGGGNDDENDHLCGAVRPGQRDVVRRGEHDQERPRASRPRCCSMAGCSWGMATATFGNRLGRSCTTRSAGHGPPPGRWSRVLRQHRHVAARWQGPRDRVRRQRRAVRPRERDMDGHREDDRHHATATWPSCCPMGRCSWRAATPLVTSRRTRPSCTTLTPRRGPRSRTCEPSASPSKPSLLPDGKALVVSVLLGASRGQPRLYDPATGSWIAPREKSRAGTYAMATLLADGRVLGDRRGADTDAAEAPFTFTRAVRPGLRDLDHHRRPCSDHTEPRRSCCSTARSSWRAAATVTATVCVLRRAPRSCMSLPACRCRRCRHSRRPRVVGGEGLEPPTSSV